MQGQEFRERLESLGLLQQELAAKLGVSAQTVSRWVTGEVPVPGYAVEYLRVLGLAHQILEGK